MTDIKVEKLVEWLGPEGAVAGLDKSDLTNADLMMVARRDGIDFEPKASRKQLTIELVMSRIQRIHKNTDQLLELSRDELKRYFTERLVSNAEILSLLKQLEIAPSRKIRGRMLDFAAGEISDLGMYARVAKGRGSREEKQGHTSNLVPKKKSQ
ncbi:hypothetical protein GCM10009127_11390 [Alteraurantiacibacter aestuarii]|uniref:Uncharacterized protein n=1 Tax=Alteraurantiacibacter aestuarii TaxID=650004 RepID=A0A844ZKX4_9SPHN|nr:hypothetical protein [Alteraurantiacibacter aestuarii]MXO87527.1 hypothetical protein [Alteraurantiacibacter aestuarii]